MIMMGRTFHPRKWRALVLLVLGVVLVSNGTYVGDDTTKEGDDNKMQYMIGVTAVLTEVIFCFCFGCGRVGGSV